jgi:hypothetical protein
MHVEQKKPVSVERIEYVPLQTVRIAIYANIMLQYFSDLKKKCGYA